MRRLLALAAAACLPALARAQTATVLGLPPEDSGVIVGRVCEDRDGDSVCQLSEPGVPGVRIILSDGTFAITDQNGRYHLAAVPARRVVTGADDHGPYVRDAYGRVNVKVEVDALGRGATVRGGTWHVVEIGPAALQEVDFPVVFAQPKATPLAPAPVSAPPGEVRAGGFRFDVTGRTVPGHRIAVEGVDAIADGEGLYSVQVPLRAGPNRLAITDLSPEGDLTFYQQSVAVVLRKQGGALFVPQPPERLAAVALPDLGSAPARVNSVVVQAPPGTVLRVNEIRATVGATGQGTLELTLMRGENQVLVELTPPGQSPIARTVTIHARGLSFASALLSVEGGWDIRRKSLSFFGRGQASGQLALGEFELAGGIDLDVDDLRQMAGAETTQGANASPKLPLDLGLILRPREPDSIERVIDPQLFPAVFGDDGVAGSWNPSSSRIWARLTHPEFGELRVGTFHADLGNVEVGRYERSLFGAALDAKAPLGPVTAEARGFVAPPFPAASVDQQQLQPQPAHDELGGTGGSLFFLHSPLVVPGSEQVRIEIRDSITSLPLEQQTLVRTRDYEIDYPSGQILLAQPLPMNTGVGPMLTTALQARQPMLVVDYEFTPATQETARAYGGRASVSVLHHVEVGASGVQEQRFDGSGGDDIYRLWAGDLKAHLGPVELSGEVARSEGSLFVPTPDGLGGFTFSDTGGLSYLTAPVSTNSWAWAWSGRASISGDLGSAQAWVRGHQANFSDAESAGQAQAFGYGAAGRLSLGRFELGGFYDDRLGPDPRDPFGSGTAHARDFSGHLTAHFGDLAVTAEGNYDHLQIPDTVGSSSDFFGWRAGAGLRLDYAISSELSVNASYHQRILDGGSGPGALDDTFAAVGASWRPKDDIGLSVRGGWGPGVGTQVQVGADSASAGEVAYGVWTVDVDGPNAGQTAAVSGARRRVDEHTDAFVEDFFVRDIDALRVGRAVGLDIAPLRNLNFSGRYERGVRLPFTGEPSLLRDAGSAKVSWLVSGVRLSALGELRHERGDAVAESDVERWQTVGGLMADARPAQWLTLGGRLLASNTRNHGATEAQAIEGYAAATLRLEPWIIIASYSLTDDIPTPAQIAAGTESRLLEHMFSVRPAVLLFDRLRIGAGFHAGLFRAGILANVFSASLRPGVRIVGGLEAAVEGAVRSQAPQGESITALRVEAAYWFETGLALAVGYNIHGFSGLMGFDQQPVSGTTDRIYVRAEFAY